MVADGCGGVGVGELWCRPRCSAAWRISCSAAWSMSAAVTDEPEHTDQLRTESGLGRLRRSSTDHPISFGSTGGIVINGL